MKRATSDQVEQLLEVAAGRRAAYADYQAGFWRPAADAIDRQRAYFNSVLDDPGVLVLTVAGDGPDLRGFAIGRLVPTPPVYDPGGATDVRLRINPVQPDTSSAAWSRRSNVADDRLPRAGRSR